MVVWPGNRGGGTGEFLEVEGQGYPWLGMVVYFKDKEHMIHDEFM